MFLIEYKSAIKRRQYEILNSKGRVLPSLAAEILCVSRLLYMKLETSNDVFLVLLKEVRFFEDGDFGNCLPYFFFVFI